MAILKTGQYAHVQVSHGGQKQVVSGGEYGHTVAVHDGEQWRQVTRKGAMVRKPAWTDDDALAHGEKRYVQDTDREHKSVKQAENARIDAVFADRRNRQLYPPALKKF